MSPPTPPAAMRLARLSLIALALLAASVVPLAAQTTETVESLHFSGEPIGDEPELSYNLEADARALLAREPKLAAATSLDETAAALRRGDRIRAFAEALAVETSPDPDLRARSHVRRAWILAQLGAVNYGAEHANEALESAAGRSELHLARAWLSWRAGEFESADREAALAANTKPTVAAWALTAWQQHRAEHTAAVETLAKLPEPDGATTPAFLTYGQAALAAGAFNVTEDYLFSTAYALQEEIDGVPATPRERLFRAVVARRDFLLGILGPPSPATVGPNLWSGAVAVARQAAVIQPDPSAWEKYFSLLAVAPTAVPDFDFGAFDLPGDLARAESEVKLAPVWRERFAAVLQRPDVRYASREIQAARRLEQHPAFQFQFRSLDAAYSNDELVQLEVFVDLHAKEVAALRKFRTELPANTPPGSRDLFFARIGLTQAIRVAAAKRDFDAASKPLEALQALRTPEGEPVPEAADLARALARHDRRKFYADIATLSTLPPAALNENAMAEVRAKADEFDAELTALFGPKYATRFFLPTGDVLLAHYLTHVRLLNALSKQELLVSCDRFNELEARTKQRGSPPYPHLESARTVVANLPADQMKATPAERTLLDLIAATKIGTPAMVKTGKALFAASPDRLNPALILALTHWRLGHDDEANAVIVQVRARARAHPPTLGQLAQIERNNSTIPFMQDHLAKLAAATPDTRAAVFKRANADGNLMANRIVAGHGGDKFNPDQIPPLAREGYAHAVTVAGLTRLDGGELIFPAFALNLVRAQKRAALVARLEAAFPEAPFTHDLRKPDVIPVWRELLQTTPLDDASANALSQRATPFLNDYVSIRLAATAMSLRRGNWDAARQYVASLRTQFGANRAFARQLDAIDACITDGLALDGTTTAADREPARQARLAQLFRELNSLAAL